MDPAVTVTDLVVDRGHRRVLNGLSFTVAANRVTGLLGPSGSGKTTLMRALVGVQQVRSGEVTVLGRPAGVRLADAAGQLVLNLSGGQQGRASLACALVSEPDVLVLDEPTVGLDPVLRVDLWDRF